MLNTTRLMNICASTALAAYLAGSFAFAQGSGVGTGRIGNAFKTKGTVESNVQGRTYPLASGGSVYQNQYVNTRAQSEAGLELLNQSKFHIGASTSVKLDKKVYDPKTQTDHVSMHVFRSKQGPASGVIKTTPSDPTSYKLFTPDGVLSVK